MEMTDNSIRFGNLCPYCGHEICICPSKDMLHKQVADLQAELEKLKNILHRANIEKISEAVHKTYCESYFRTHGKQYWTKGDYDKLSEEIKEYDRNTVRTVIFELKQALNMKGDKT